jgi:hypothetical protein
MKVNRGDSISTEWLTIYPNCGRELKFEWLITETWDKNKRIPNPLPLKESMKDYFHKFSELQISPLEMKILQQEYSEQLKSSRPTEPKLCEKIIK